MIAVHGSMGEGGGRYEAAAIVLPTTFRDLWKGAMEIELHWSSPPVPWIVWIPFHAKGPFLRILFCFVYNYS